MKTKQRKKDARIRMMLHQPPFCKTCGLVLERVIFAVTSSFAHDVLTCVNKSCGRFHQMQ